MKTTAATNSYRYQLLPTNPCTQVLRRNFFLFKNWPDKIF